MRIESIHLMDSTLYTFDILDINGLKFHVHYVIVYHNKYLRPFFSRKRTEITQKEYLETLEIMLRRYPDCVIYEDNLPFERKLIPIVDINEPMRISRNCIENFISNHGFQIDEEIVKDGSGLEGKIVLKGDKTIAMMRYSLHNKTKELNISLLKSNIKNISNFKFFKIALLMLLSEYLNKADKFTLMASPNGKIYEKGTEFCLMCYYEQLGFEFVNKSEIFTFFNKCKKQLKDVEKYDSCLLCKCQKLGMDISLYSADMYGLATNIKNILLDYYDEIC